MDITKSGIINIIIVVILSIPLDQEIYDFSADFLQVHPAIYKALSPLLKKLISNDNKPKEINNEPKIKGSNSTPNMTNDASLLS